MVIVFVMVFQFQQMLSSNDYWYITHEFNSYNDVDYYCNEESLHGQVRLPRMRFVKSMMCYKDIFSK